MAISLSARLARVGKAAAKARPAEPAPSDRDVARFFGLARGDLPADPTQADAAWTAVERIYTRGDPDFVALLDGILDRVAAEAPAR